MVKIALEIYILDIMIKNIYLQSMFLKNYNLVDAIKRVFKLKDKNNDLYLVLSMITDQFNTDPKALHIT